jgi:hypothetical protein
MKYEELYAELGKLLYAVADIDRKVSIAEKKRLIELIHERLIPHVDKSDEYGTSVAFYPEFQFSYLEGEIADAETAFNDFLDYLEEHHTGIDLAMRNTCLELAREIAEASYGINKEEQALLDELKRRFNRLELMEFKENNGG